MISVKDSQTGITIQVTSESGFPIIQIHGPSCDACRPSCDIKLNNVMIHTLIDETCTDERWLPTQRVEAICPACAGSALEDEGDVVGCPSCGQEWPKTPD